MTQPDHDVDEGFDPGPVPEEELIDDGEAGALAALAQAELDAYSRAAHKAKPIVEGVE